MKYGKLAGIMLAILNVILIVVCAVFYFRTDRHKPELTFSSAELVYREGMEESVFLQGISAYDSVDGDITDRVVIEKTMENRDDNTIVVFYAVSDKAGNAAKASRVFDMEPAMEPGISTELHPGSTAGDGSMDGLSGESGDLSGEEGEQETVETSSGEPTPEPTPRFTATPRRTAEPVPETTPTPRPTATPGQAEEPVLETAPEPAPVQAPAVDSSAPVLTLKVSEVSVDAGQGPAWVNVIGTLQDDKDDYGTLFNNLSVSKYDRNKPGTYQVTVFTEDSDGNRSQTVPLTIIVK